MRKRYCSVCGRLMNEHVDETTGKPFDIQLCSGVCIGAAWRNVVTSIKNGVQPQWHKVKNRRANKAYIYHNKIIELLYDGHTQKEIAEIMGLSTSTVSVSIKKYGREKIKMEE